ncbi:hypothetical protein [Roseateles koreensis]|uniref:TonB C-terminal domain-containing protein n=1 Tax=Roseateles koreensis TaxID=2987526 RepID=A0ABT5KUK2_9BURK|nr:hypothetical protein [Roseateles koreensis]MDC8785496.1 hypothetical protein [Roseateles koreensis]
MNFRQGRAWFWCAAAALAGHGLVLLALACPAPAWVPAFSRDSAGEPASTAGHRSDKAVRIRWNAESDWRLARPIVEVTTEVPEAASAPITMPADAPLPERLRGDPTLGDAPAPVQALALIGSASKTPADGSEWDGYVPRPKLTQPPVMRESPMLPWPDGWTADGHYREILALYIDEKGVVQRVRVEGEGLPPAFQDLARKTFMGVQFVPGQLTGRDVKSLIRVEVNFDEDPHAKAKGLR